MLHHPNVRTTLSRSLVALSATGLLALAGCRVDSNGQTAAASRTGSKPPSAAAARGGSNRDLPRTADAAERWLESARRQQCAARLTASRRSLPATADAAERWLANC